MAKKKEEPAKPAAIQLIFQAPDLPTPKVNPRSGKLAEDEKPIEKPQPKAKQPKEKQAPKEKTKPEESEKESGSTRMDAKRQRRRDSRDGGRRRSSVTESEFLARRESVDRTMVVREKDDRIQIGVLEDGMLVEHYVAESQGGSLIGNVYLGKVQNVLPSMEAAFVDIGRGRNAVLYSGEVDWELAETGNQPRRIELALKSGDTVLVQVTKDPVGQKGARLTSQVSLPGRFLVYVPGGNMSGISRKLPEGERQRLKQILKHALPEDAGVIVRTAAEGASEEQLIHDVERLKAQWESINEKVAKGKAPMPLHSARLMREGSDLTLLAYGPMVTTALQAAELGAEEGINIEVIDLRSMSPIDFGTILSSVQRTGRLVVAHEASTFVSISSEIAAKIAELAFYHLEAPVLRVGGFDVPYPAAKLEEHFLPDADRILEAVDRVLAY